MINQLLPTPNSQLPTVIDAQGKFLIPGVIDTHVHFREPGLEYKGDINTESKAAVAGGVTGFFEMPNTIPNVVSLDVLDKKNHIASEKSLANYSFYLGAANNNTSELLKANPDEVCGVKLFLGTSTGNMTLGSKEALNELFSGLKIPIAAHCEDDAIIKSNLEFYKRKYGDDIPFRYHPMIRSAEACYKSTSEAIELAHKYNTRLHIVHVSTAKELELFNNSLPVNEKRVTAEVCVPYFFFDERDYDKFGALLKCNPAIKSEYDRLMLLEGLKNNSLDTIATDHAPHILEEKNNNYVKAPSGIPSVQHSLPAMLELYHKGIISLEKIVEKMCHNPAVCFNIDRRGFIRRGYWADLALVDLDSPWTVNKDNIVYKSKWSLFENYTFKSKVTHTFVNGHLCYDNGKFDESIKGRKILFKR